MVGIRLRILLFFFFNDTATTEIYTLSLHDALPISQKTGPYFWLFLQPLVFLPFLLLVVGHFAWGVRPEIGLLHQIPEPSHLAGRLDNRSVTLDPTSWHSQMVGRFAWGVRPEIGLLYQIPEPSHPAGRLDHQSVTSDLMSWH